MNKYHKIQSVYKRDPATNMRTFLDEYSTPEIEYLAKNDWTFTEKIDGTNIRIEWDGELVTIGGRTDAAQIPTFLLTRLNELFPVTKLAKVFPPVEGEETAVTLHGEGFGVKIQKRGALYLPDGVDFILFDIRIGHWWLKRDAVASLAAELGCLVVPEMGKGTIADAVDVVFSGLWSALGDCEAEGLVLRPAVEMLGRGGRRIITKLKAQDFAGS
jgi:hypothetical protein